MTGSMKTLAASVVVLFGLGTFASAQTPPPAQGKQPGGQRAQPGGRQGQPGDQIAPGDVEAMFEAMTVMEAERFVALTPDQFPAFVQRLKKLQEARVQRQRRHNRALAELRALSNPQNAQADDAAIDAKLKELDAIEVESHAAIGKAMDAIDQLLSVRQRARFRVLEDNIEKKKLDFLTRVRQQGGRGGL